MLLSHNLNYLVTDNGNLSVNFQGSDGHTALHSACYQGHIDIVHNLLERGADINLLARCVKIPLNIDVDASPPRSP